MQEERTLFDAYPGEPGHKVGGTSKDAAASMKPTAPIIRARVLARLRELPLTPDECAMSIGLPILSVRPRFSELLADGCIEPTGERRKNASKRAANVYRVKR